MTPAVDDRFGPRADPLPADVVDALVQVSFAVIAVLSQVAAEHDLSLTQLRVLAILRDRQPQMAELARHLGLERSSVSGLIERAVQRGLVRRAASPAHGRAVHVTLTAQGQHLGRQIAVKVGALIEPMTDRLPPADRKRLQQLLSRMIPEPGPTLEAPIGPTS